MPSETERLQIFDRAFPEDFRLSDRQEVEGLIANYELSGGNIWEIVVYASTLAVKRKKREVYPQDIYKAIKKELTKEGKAFKHFEV
jgi:ATP-dependent 26S proteasome regulatory subunit